MKNSIISSLSIVLMTVFITVAGAATKSGSLNSIIGKQWKLTSIITNPPIVDVDGDGTKDPEAINSLSDAQKSRIIIFKSNGLVEEKHINNNGDLNTIKNGSWKVDAASDTFLWFLPDGTSLKGKYTNNSLVLNYTDEKLDIKYTLSLLEMVN